MPGSDIDIAVLVNEKEQDDREILFDIADKFRERGLKFSPRVFEQEERFYGEGGEGLELSFKRLQ